MTIYLVANLSKKARPGKVGLLTERSPGYMWWSAPQRPQITRYLNLFRSCAMRVFRPLQYKNRRLRCHFQCRTGPELNVGGIHCITAIVFYRLLLVPKQSTG
jgi:hypothetical protein